MTEECGRNSLEEEEEDGIEGFVSHLGEEVEAVFAAQV